MITYSIVCCSHNKKILTRNLLRSPNLNNHQVIINKNSKNIPSSYNKSIDIAENEFIIFVHHDVFLPKTFFEELEEYLKLIKKENWGLIGVAGKTRNGEDAGFICDRGNIFGGKKNPIEVQSLDEVLLIKKRDQLKFDENIPSTHHLFATDLCLQYENAGKKNYAISAYCEHNSLYDNQITKSWYESEKYIRNKWSKYLPIQTTCKRIE